MFVLAVADGAVTVNPVRDVPALLNTAAKKAPRALIRDETAPLVEFVPQQCASDRAGSTGSR